MQLQGKSSRDLNGLKGGRRFPQRRQASVWKPTPTQLFGAGLLVLAALAVYWTSLGTAFVFDDIPAIERNATIRLLWPPWPALNPPNDGSGVSGRPLVNLSLAVNYALGGQQVRGYHLANTTLHALAALTLWGLLRRTLLIGGAVPQPGSEFLTWICTLLWTVHPLLTESVVCVVQRNEILGSLFYLQTLYTFTRGVSAAREAGMSAPSGGAPSESW